MTISYHTQTIIFKLHFQQVNSTYSKSRRSIDEINASCDQMRSENQLHFCEAWKSHPSISEIQTLYPEMCKSFLNTKYIKKLKEDKSLMRNVKISEMIILIVNQPSCSLFFKSVALLCQFYLLFFIFFESKKKSILSKNTKIQQ